MMTITILCALGMFVTARAGLPMPEGECTSCDEAMNDAVEMLAIGAESMDPVVMNDQAICKKVTISGVKTICNGGPSCLVTEPSPSTAKWQKFSLKVKTLKVVCEIVPLKDFGKAVGINIPVPDIKIPFFGGGKQEPDKIIIDSKNLHVHIVARFQDDNTTIEQCDLAQGEFDDMKLHLEGGAIFTKLGELITKPEPVRSALGYSIKMGIRLVLNHFLADPKMGSAISMLSCES